MAEPFTIYKLTILYMLSKAGFPLSNTQISNFFLEQEYLIGLQVKAHLLGRRVDGVFRTDDGADGHVLGLGMGGDDTDIPPHDLHPGQIAAQRAGLRQGKALGADGGGDALVGHTVVL